MLLELSIKDFAIIDSLHLQLNSQFNVFTGETGAGKSIIIDAVNALLGGKIGAEFVRAGCERSSIEGIFQVAPLPMPNPWPSPDEEEGKLSLFEAFEQSREHEYSQEQTSADPAIALAALLREFDIQPEEGQLILTRDIFRSGRTVSRINGRTVSLHVLQQVSSWLIDIHGQSENMSLLRTDQHVNFLDRYAECLPLREELAAQVNAWRDARKQLQNLLQNEREQTRRAEFLRFVVEEIDKAELQPGEEEELDQEQTVLSNAERLRELCTMVYGLVKGSDLGGDGFQPALDQLNTAERSLDELTRLDTSLQEQATNLAEAIYRLEDVAASISSYESDIEDNPARLAEIGERLDLISRLKRKYGATIEEIIQYASTSRTELESLGNRDETVEKLKKQDQQYRRKIGTLAQQLSARRRKAATRLSTAMEEQLNDLNMKRARFSVEIAQTPEPHGVPASIDDQPEGLYACDLTGIDQVQFLIAPNPGEPFKPLTKIASGGETSRLMLALKTILSAADATPTLIFDEIDAGISGSSGKVVGEKLWMLTHNHQVICVTHLPQIASFADTHYNVNKQIFDDRTITLVNELRPEQRVREIAHIMGGNVTEYSMKSAEEMLAGSDLWKENRNRQLANK